MSWDQKRTKDAYLASIPYGLRQQMEASKKNEKQSENKDCKEATMAAAIATIAKPMLVGREKGTEDSRVKVKEAVEVGKTSPGGSDSHTHLAYVDDMGNGYTSTVDAGEYSHAHDIKSFQVAPWQDTSGLFYHEHPGELDKSKLPTYEPTLPYTGEM